MPGSSTIEWTEATWNPVTGCSKVSPGCAHCYAETLSLRFGRSRHHWLPEFASENIVLHEKRLDQPLRWRQPRMIFVNSMSDLFHELIPLEFIERVFDVMASAHEHTFQILTKRHERLAELAPALYWPANVWMGVSIENQRWTVRADYLRQVPAAVRFISAEPLLGPISDLDLTGIHWLIAGGESGARHRPVDPGWVRALRDQCVREGVAFFFKQWGGHRPQSNGRKLDGREWDELPVAASATTNGRMPRPRDVPDGSDEKWEYTQHTEAKHEILRRYLGAWLAILGRGKHPRLVLIDGFAGRGRYNKGQPGSPRIMFDRAVDVVESGAAKEVWIRCAEPDPENFKILKDVCSKLKHERVKIQPKKQTFEEIANDFADWAETQSVCPPTFVMVDPFGAAGVTLELLQRLLKLERLEVLLTLMVRDPARFLGSESWEEPMTALYGGESWRDCLDKEKRDECLLLRFQNIVRERAIAKHATPFRVFEDERRTILYYLVHMTNNDLGMRKMKEAMVHKSGDMTFWPITVRPSDQIALEVDEQKPFPSLQDRLLKKYAGKTLTFEDLLNDDYPDGLATEPKYRAAIADLTARDKEPKITIVRDRKTPSGKPATRGVKESDKLTFPA